MAEPTPGLHKDSFQQKHRINHFKRINIRMLQLSLNTLNERFKTSEEAAGDRNGKKTNNYQACSSGHTLPQANRIIRSDIPSF